MSETIPAIVEIISVSISGLVASIISIFIYETGEKYFKIFKDNRFKTKEFAVFVFIVIFAIVGSVAQYSPYFVESILPCYVLQGPGLIVILSWFLVHYKIANWEINNIIKVVKKAEEFLEFLKQNLLEGNKDSLDYSVRNISLSFVLVISIIVFIILFFNKSLCIART